MPIRREFWYSTDGETRYQLPTIFAEWRDIAVDAAEDYHHNHDGWEAEWPVDIAIYETEEGPMLARFRVERETVPQFSAYELKDELIHPNQDESPGRVNR